MWEFWDKCVPSLLIKSSSWVKLKDIRIRDNWNLHQQKICFICWIPPPIFRKEKTCCPFRWLSHSNIPLVEIANRVSEGVWGLDLCFHTAPGDGRSPLDRVFGDYGAVVRALARFLQKGKKKSFHRWMNLDWKHKITRNICWVLTFCPFTFNNHSLGS